MKNDPRGNTKIDHLKPVEDKQPTLFETEVLSGARFNVGSVRNERCDDMPRGANVELRVKGYVSSVKFAKDKDGILLRYHEVKPLAVEIVGWSAPVSTAPTEEVQS